MKTSALFRRQRRTDPRLTCWPAGTYPYPVGLGHVTFGHMGTGDDFYLPSLDTDTLLMGGIRLGCDLHARCTGPALEVAAGCTKADWPHYTCFQMEDAALAAELLALADVSFDAAPA